MFKKKFISIALISGMVITSVPMNTLASANTTIAQEVAVTDKNQEAMAKNLEEVLKIVKSKIAVPKELSVFNSYFNSDSYSNGVIWQLNWYNEDYSSSVRIQADNRGNILEYNYEIDRDKSASPKYLKEELKDTASNFIKKIAPEIYAKLEYVKGNDYNTYGGKYIYTFHRVENGIALADNAITVGVNYNTGKVVSYDSNYLYDLAIPSGKEKITKEKAIDIIKKNIKMELTYLNIYDTDSEGNTKIKAFLAYQPNQSYITVDAKTGEVYTTKSTWTDGKTESSKDDSSVSGESELTKEEIEKIQEIKNIISKEDAIKKVQNNKKLYIDSSSKAITANLSKLYDNSSSKSTKYAWYINFSDPREVDYSSKDIYRASTNAVVDAQTGQIISFYSSVKDYNSMTQKEIAALKIKYSIEQGKNLFESFVKEQIADKFNKSKFIDNSNNTVIIYKDGTQAPTGYSYNYSRVNEGVLYDYNGIYGGVDSITGKVTSFNYNWNDNVTFESPKNIITADKAFDFYMSGSNFGTIYELNSTHTYNDSGYTVKHEARLVYKNSMNPSLISPFTGKRIDNDGKEYSENKNAYTYSDINDLSMARDIRLLAEIGIGFEGGKFLPNEVIKGKELNNFLSLVGYYNTNKYPVLSKESSLTRIEASKILIGLLGYDKIANIKGIYNINFTDKDLITSDNVGTVSIINGLNLLSTNSAGAFKPNDKLTRSEVIGLIMGLLQLNE